MGDAGSAQAAESSSSSSSAAVARSSSPYTSTPSSSSDSSTSSSSSGSAASAEAEAAVVIPGSRLLRCSNEHRVSTVASPDTAFVSPPVRCIAVVNTKAHQPGANVNINPRISTENLGDASVIHLRPSPEARCTSLCIQTACPMSQMRLTRDASGYRRRQALL